MDKKLIMVDSKNFLNGSLSIFLDKPFYFAGETILGRVDFRTEEPLECDDKGLALKLTCATSVTVIIEYSDSKGNIHQDFHYSNEKETLSKLTLLTGEEKIEKGLYKFGFQLAIPQNSASSFDFFQRLARASVQFRLNVSLDKFKSNINFDFPTVVYPPPPVVAVPFTLTTEKTLLFYKGKITIVVKSPKNFFHSGEILPLNVEVINPTKKPLKDVKVLQKLSPYLKSLPLYNLKKDISLPEHTDHCTREEQQTFCKV